MAKGRIDTIYEFRPIEKVDFRYAEGKWIPDDGEYDLAFTRSRMGPPICYYVQMPYKKNLLWSHVWFGNWWANIPRHPSENAWHYESCDGISIFTDIQSWDRNAHPNEIAGRSGMDFLCKKHSCANGSSVDFNPLDEHIKAGLLRELDTKKIIKTPKTIDCIYCGRIDVKEADNGQ